MSDYAADGFVPRPAGIRDPLAEHRKALEAKIAELKDLGQPPSSFLLGLLAEVDEREVREGRRPAKEPVKVPEPVVEPVVVEATLEGGSVLEHAAAEAPPEKVAPEPPRGPGRPRKPTDSDR